jgi:hypothetical protein
MSTVIFTAAMEKKALDLGTSDKDLMRMAEKVFGQGGNEEDQMKFQIALQSRANRASAWSNLMRTLSEVQRSIIQNLRY